MRAEDKQLEGQDLEREQRVEASREHEVEELPAFAGEAVRDAGFEHRSRLFDALQLILAGERINVSLLYLPQRETHALEALQTAVTGHDSMGEFIYAEDRHSLLEQALAVMQRNLTYGDAAQLATLQSKFDVLTSQVGELRETLGSLEDAQEEREEFHQAARPGAAGATDAAANPQPTPAPAPLDGP
ncbi:MAG: hypothetical protein M3680_26970, partial [Myxococcota bacterium]|nr:hypothetical protein [Myxococcota bacterium]